MTHPDAARPTGTIAPGTRFDSRSRCPRGKRAPAGSQVEQTHEEEPAAELLTLPPTSRKVALATAFFPSWTDSVERVARRIGLPYRPVFAEVWFDGASLLTALEALGAELHLNDAELQWFLRPEGSATIPPTERLVALERGIFASDFQGAFGFTLDGRRWLAGRAEIGRHPGTRLVGVLGGPSLRELLELTTCIRETVSTMKDGQLQVYGSQMGSPTIGDVEAADLVLAPALESSVLSFVDGFHELATKPSEGDRRQPQRSHGMLLLGRPGTGKTLTIRHVLGRLEGCRRYLYVPAVTKELEPHGYSFPSLVQTLAGHSRPSVVVVEDIDRLFESGSVTPQYFLNVLDGLLRPSAPTLWIATCNDPSDLPENLTDRPGRFDRIFVFEPPGMEERVRLLRRYAREGLSEEEIRELASAADGLTGAHIAEACRAAGAPTAGAADEFTRYGRRLALEVDMLRRQQTAAQRYGRKLRGAAVGF